MWSELTWFETTVLNHTTQQSVKTFKNYTHIFWILQNIVGNHYNRHQTKEKRLIFTTIQGYWKSIKNAISIWCRWNACPFTDWFGNEILISGKQSELGVGCFSKLKYMSPHPLLLLDSSIHAQITSQFTLYCTEFLKVKMAITPWNICKSWEKRICTCLSDDNQVFKL